MTWETVGTWVSSLLNCSLIPHRVKFGLGVTAATQNGLIQGCRPWQECFKGQKWSFYTILLMKNSFWVMNYWRRNNWLSDWLVSREWNCMRFHRPPISVRCDWWRICCSFPRCGIGENPPRDYQGFSTIHHHEGTVSRGHIHHRVVSHYNVAEIGLDIWRFFIWKTFHQRL